MSLRVGVSLRVGFAWWVRPYLYGLAWATVLMRREPDWAKLERMLRRGLRIRVQ